MIYCYARHLELMRCDPKWFAAALGPFHAPRRATDQVQTIKISRIIPVRPTFGRTRQARRRGGVVEGGTKTFSAASDNRILNWIADNPVENLAPAEEGENDEGFEEDVGVESDDDADAHA